MKRILSIISLLLFASFMSFSQDNGKLLHSGVYHEYNVFTFMGNSSVLESNKRIDVYENYMRYYLYDNGQPDGARANVFVGLNSEGERIYKQEVPNGTVYFFVFKKDNNIVETSGTYTYTQGYKPVGGAVPSSMGTGGLSQKTILSCPTCGGRGKLVSGTQYYNNLPDRYCDWCGKFGTYHDHYFYTCETCVGQGFIER